MIRRRHLLGLLLILMTAGCLYLKKKADQQMPQIKKVTAISETQKIPEVTARSIASQPTTEKQKTAASKLANIVSPEWQESLEESIKIQGGDSLKSVTIKKLGSHILSRDGMKLNVESVLIAVKNDKNEETSFKAMVDAQTGKILESWDRPVYDPANPRDDFKMKIDPRYTTGGP